MSRFTPVQQARFEADQARWLQGAFTGSTRHTFYAPREGNLPIKRQVHPTTGKPL